MNFIRSLRPWVTTMVIFIIMGVATVLPLDWDIANPIAQAFGDFEFTDIIFSTFKEEERDTNIVIVNIGNLDRAGIAAEINKIQSFQPACIGLDAIFRKPKDFFADSMLADAIQKSGKVTLASEALGFHEDSGTADSIATSHPMFSTWAKSGLSNLDSRNFRTIRNFSPLISIQNKDYYAFGLSLAFQYDSIRAQTFLQRKNKFEDINYRGNIAHFYRVLDVSDVLENPDLSFLRNKIVLMGYVNFSLQSGDPSSVTDISDAFFTPMNTQIAGRSIPDMNGVVIHANILSMILSGKTINPMSDEATWFTAILFCWFNCVIFMWVLYRKPLLFGLFARVFQLIQGLFILYLTLWLFEQNRYQLSTGTMLIIIALSPDITEWVMEIWDRFQPFEVHRTARKGKWKNLKISQVPLIKPDKHIES